MGLNKNFIEYCKLWDNFAEILDDNNLTLPKFAKNWDKVEYERYSNSETSEDSFHTNLKKMRTKRNKNIDIKIEQKSLDTIVKYIQFLKKDYVVQYMHDDESYENWYD